jgi:ABC-type sugar transport system substrate-binding protein
MAAGKKPGDIKIAGFDGSPGGLDMMKQGWQQANAAQMLAKIGQVGVETAVAAAQGDTAWHNQSQIQLPRPICVATARAIQ